MLEGVVTSLLNQYLSQFLEGLDADQLKISIWGGDVNLVNVQVRSGALDLLHLPITVKHGSVQKLHISANWRHLSSRPVKVVLSGVHIVAVPSSSSHIDSAKETANALANKLAKLQGMEDIRFGESEDGEEESSSDSYIGKLTTRILDNVEIVLKDIHIRYEDFVGDHPPISFGVALEELRAETTDADWQPMFQKNVQAPKSFKMVTLTNLFAYMDANDAAAAAQTTTEAKSPKSPTSPAHSSLSIASLLANPSTPYLLRPVSGYLRLWLNKSVQPPPRLWAECQLYDISLQLNETQYGELIGLLSRITASNRGIDDLMASFTEHFRVGTIAERRMYVDLYKRTLNAMWLEPLTTQLLKNKEELEQQLRYQDIRAYRLAAIGELKRELGIVGAALGGTDDKKMKSADRARASIMLRERATKLTSTFLSKIGVGKAKEIKPERALTDAEKEEIYANAEHESAEVREAGEALSRDYVHLQLKFVLDTLGFSLADGRGRPIAVLQADQTSVHLTVRDESISTIATLGNIVMTDRFTKNTCYPEIIHNVEKMRATTSAANASTSGPKTDTQTTTLTRAASSFAATSTLASSPLPGSHILQIEVHSPPLDDSCDVRVAVRCKAPRIVLQKPFLDRLLRFFTPPEAVNWSALTYNQQDVMQLRDFTSLNLGQSVQQHPTIDISIDLTAPTIVVPRDPTAPESDVLVVDLGRVKFKTRARTKAAQQEFARQLLAMTPEQHDALTGEDRDRCYDQYNIAVKQVQIFLCTSAAVSSGALIAQESRIYLLNPFDVGTDLGLCMSHEILTMPDTRVSVDLPLLHFSLSDRKYTRLVLLLAAFESILSLLVDQPANPPDSSVLDVDFARSTQTFVRRLAASDDGAVVKSALSSTSSAAREVLEAALDLAALTKLLNNNLRDAKILMEQIDADHSGTITRDEFGKWLSTRQKARERKETVEVDVKLTAIVVTLDKDGRPHKEGRLAKTGGEATSTAVMEVRVDGIAVQVRQQTFQLHIGLVIGALSIADIASTYTNSRYLLNTNHAEKTSRERRKKMASEASFMLRSASPDDITASPEVRQSRAGQSSGSFLVGDEFINISLTMTSDQSPVFGSSPIDMDLRVGFGAVSICFEPESVKRLGVYVMDTFVLNEAVNQVFMRDTVAEANSGTVMVVSPGTDQMRTIMPDGSAPNPAAQSKSTARVPRAARISVNLLAHFDSVRIDLFSQDQPVLETIVNSLRGELQLFSAGSLHAFLQLREITIKDCTPAGAIHPYAVTTRAHDQKEKSTAPDALVCVEYNSYSSAESDYPGHDESFRASVHGLQFTLLTRLVYELMFYFSMGPIADFIEFVGDQVAAATAATAPQSATLGTISTAAATLSQDCAVMAVARFIKLDISLSDVDVLVPLHSESSEYARAVVERIGVTNLLREDENNERFQQMTVDAAAFRIISLIHAHGDQPKLLLDLTPFTVAIDFLAHKSRVCVDFGVDELTATLAPAQFTWAVALTQLNFAESAQVVKPIKKQRIPRSRRTSTSGSTLAAPSVLGIPAPNAHSPSPAPITQTLPPNALVFSLSATLHKLSFMLTENSFDPETASGALAAFTMMDIRSTMGLLANGGLDAKSYCGAMSMTDLSASGSFVGGKPILPEYREVLVVVRELNAARAPAQKKALATSQSASESPIYFSLHRTVDDRGVAWTVVEVSIANFRFGLSPVLLRLPTIFAPPTKVEEAENAAILARLAQGPIQMMPATLPSIEYQAPVMAAPAPPSYVVLKLHLANPVIQLVRDPTSRVSEAILLTFGAQTEVLISNQSSQSVLSADFELMAFKCYTTQLDVAKIGFVRVSDDPNVSAVIIQPFGASGTVKVTTPSDAIDAETILEKTEDPMQPPPLPVLHATCNIDPITARLSYQTYRLGLRTMEALSSATSADEMRRVENDAEIARKATVPKSITPVAPRPRPSQGGQSASSPLDLAAATADLDSLVQVRPKQAQLFNAEEITIGLRHLHLSLINDASNIDVPIARVQVSDVRVQVHGYAHQRVCRGELGLVAEFYNQSLVAWEPVLEYSKLRVDLTSTYILSTADFNRSLDPNAQATSDASAVSSDDSQLVTSDRGNLGDYTNSGALLSNRAVISSPSGLNCNVTHTMFRSVMDCLELFAVVNLTAAEEEERERELARVGIAHHSTHLLANANLQRDAASAASSTVGIGDTHGHFHSARFDNFSEMDLTIVMQSAATPVGTADSTAEPPADRVLQLGPYSTISFDFPQEIPLSEHQVSVQARKAGYGALDIVALLRRNCAHTHTITLDEGETARVVFEVFVQCGVKVCRLRSPIGLRNHTNMPIEVKSMGRGVTKFRTLDPGDLFFCPIKSTHETGGFLVAMRPPRDETKQQQKSDFEWSSPIVLLQEYNRQNQYAGCMARTPSPDAANPSAAAPGDLTFTVHVTHLWEHDDGESDVDLASVQDADKSKGEYSGQVYVIEPVIQIQNLLAAEVEVRLVEKTSKEVTRWQSSIARGGHAPVHALLQSDSSYLQLRIGSLLTRWSDLLSLPTAPTEGAATVNKTISVFDDNKRELQIHVELQMEGSIRVVLYVPFWIYDLTHLGLILSCDRAQTVPLGALDDFRKRLTSDERTPIMFNFPTNPTSGSSSSKKKVDGGVMLTTLSGVETARNWTDVQWSEPIMIDKLSVATTTTIPGPRKKISPTDIEASLRNLSDIGIRIEHARGRWHRTKLIHLTPHFVLINRLGCELEFMQRCSNKPEVARTRSGPAPSYFLPAGETKELVWPDADGNRSLCFRRAGSEYVDWRWSGDIDPAAAGDVPMMVRHKSDPNRVWFARVEIQVRQATVFVHISQYEKKTMKLLLPYRIQNQTANQHIRVRQWIPPIGSKAATTAVAPRDWIAVPPYSVFHFAPEVPLYSRPCQLEVQLGLSVRDGVVVADRTIQLNLDEIKTHARVTVPPIVGDVVRTPQTVHVYSESDGGATIVLKVSSHASAETFATELRKSGNFGHKQIIARQREKRWKELGDLRNELDTRIGLLQTRIEEELARNQASEATTGVTLVRPRDMPLGESAIIIDVRGARGLAFKESYVQLTFGRVSHKTAAITGTNTPTFGRRFTFNSTVCDSSSVLHIGLFEKMTLVSDRERGVVDLPLFNMDHQPKSSWLVCRNAKGEVQGELDCTIWHVPKADSHSQSNEKMSELDRVYQEKRRILESVTAEMTLMQSRQMIDANGRVMPVHLQNDVEFKVQLRHIDGLQAALAGMHCAGDVVCRMRSELTGKTASVMVWQHDPDDEKESVQQGPKGGTAVKPVRRWSSDASASSSSSSSKGQSAERATSPATAPPSSTSSPSNSSAASSAATTPVPLPVSWRQEVSIFVPEEMLSKDDEVLHLAFFFQPQDFAAAADTTAVEAALDRRTTVHSAEFLRATRLRANTPPIALAHLSLPLSSVPIDGTKEALDSRIGTKTQREKQLVDWRQNRVPLQIDLHSLKSEMWLTLAVTRMPAKSEENRLVYGLELHLPSVSLSLIDAEPREVLYFSITDTHVLFGDTLCTQELEVKVHCIQLDNQNPAAVFPIIIGFSPVEPGEIQPLIQLSVAKRKSRTPTVQIFEYASLLVQQIDVKVEEELIYAILRFINSFQDAEADFDAATETDDSWYVMRASEFLRVEPREYVMLFFEFLQVQPIAVNVSFEASPGVRARMSQMKYNPMDTVLSIAGTAMGSIHAAPIRLNGRTFEHVRGSVPVILGSLAHFYTGQIIAESYKVLGSFEFLGNPVGLVNNLGSGVVDFFYLPSKGAVESPQKFGVGLAKGSLSLVKGITSGVFNAAGNITGSVSKGIAMASFDSSFIESSATRQQNSPKHLADGLFQGGKSLAGGLFKGVTGIVTDPYKGAKEGGASGFFKGMGKGLLGVVAKPAAGAVGFASQTLTGIGNTAEFLSDNKLHPKHHRPQRFISSTDGLQPFDLVRAQENETRQKEELQRVNSITGRNKTTANETKKK